MSLTPLANGFCFGEGPRWFEGLLWWSDMLGEAVHTVNLAGDVTTLALAGHAPSGLGFRPDGSLKPVATDDDLGGLGDGDIVNENSLLLTLLQESGEYVIFVTSAENDEDYST